MHFQKPINLKNILVSEWVAMPKEFKKRTQSTILSTLFSPNLEFDHEMFKFT